ncbi:MAG: phosphate ABC transporter permease PstA [Candidatus Sumerlaeaceae bacterium]|nr:phosphate ABC transporter permease PstA [Candidatus Sumerlaeaceae bacterium]
MEKMRKAIHRRRQIDRMFQLVGVVCTSIGVTTIAALLVFLVVKGANHITWEFMRSYPSRFPQKAGILPALVGSALVMLVTAVLAIPVGIAAAVFLDEYAPRNRLSNLIELNITNLAGVPSIIYGLMALGIVVYALGLGRSIAAAGITLALLILPIVITATREALRSIPREIREAAFAQGATRWQVVRYHLLPYSLSGIATGVIIALSRAVGETAPLITIGALSFIAFLPPSPLKSEPPFVSFEWLSSPFTVLPIQIFNWVSRPQPAFHEIAAAASVILIIFTLLLNSTAMILRRRARARLSW